ncbi:myb-like protein X [Polistes fuscatus]|uniref:myb-like protein X n=1 Tax=Polistes fuscatus TaxID=30207 RepID=UPI001CA8DBCA|nr:myb-like protein X [Polistes fuscatus]
MKNAYPVVTAASSSPVDPDSNNETSNCDDQTAPIIRLKLDKPLHWDWELTTTANTVPVIQLLDRDGKLLVETTGKTAQRARGSFREGLTTYEEFPNISRSTSVTSKPSEPVRTGNRNMDGFSNKFGSVEFGLRPRKSRSDANIKFIPNDRKVKCKQNKQLDQISSPLSPKKYSTGDFLRRQILDDLRTKSTLGKSPDEVAKERCRKVKAYLRSQSDLLPGIVNSENDLELENNSLESKIDLNEEECSSKLDNRSLESKEHALLSSVPLVDGKVVTVPVDPVKLVRIRSFLTEKLRERMEREDRLPINKRHSDCSYLKNGREGGDYRRRKVRSETNVIGFFPGDNFNDENMSPRPIGQLEDQNTRENQKENEVKVSGDGKTIANVISRSSISSSSSSLFVPTIRKNKNYHRSKSDALLTAKSTNDFELKKNKTRRGESSDRRRTYRKTKSDLFFDNPFEESKKDLDRIERSWRDYKERKKLEKLQRETESRKEEEEEVEQEQEKKKKEENEEGEEEDLTGKTKWRKDFQSELCGARNCKICQNLRISLKPTETETKLYSFRINPDKDNSIQLENNENNNNNHSQSSSTIVSPDFGYNSIPKSVFKDYRELYARSNVKKSDTFKIIDGSEDGYEETLVEDNPDDDDKPEQQKEEEEEENSSEMISLANKSNEDIARDYFKRVYELLKKRQEEARKIAEKRDVHGYDDSSSSNYVEEVRRRKHRRRKRDTAHGTFVNVKSFILRTRFHCAKRRYLCDVANGSSTRFRNV